MLIKKLGINWTTLRSWERQDPRLTDVMAITDLEFLEQIDTAGRILALGGVEGKDTFAGWNRYPSEWMIRFYLNTTGRRYGYGEAPLMTEAEEDFSTNVESGIDIESWITKEMSAKKKVKRTTRSDNQPRNILPSLYRQGAFHHPCYGRSWLRQIFWNWRLYRTSFL